MFWTSVADFQNLATLDLLAILEYISDKVYWMILITLMMVVVLAVGDFLFQRWRWIEKMKMTKQEVKDEHKQQEGDPQVKAKIKSLRIQRARKRMMAAVPKADVVITNPTHYAVALKYDMEAMAAPVLVAKGVDLASASAIWPTNTTCPSSRTAGGLRPLRRRRTDHEIPRTLQGGGRDHRLCHAPEGQECALKAG